MEFLADLHIHSRFSRATSRDLTLEALHRAALEKGITVVGTGDFTHPAWLGEIRERLVEAEDGLYRLRDDLARQVAGEVPASCRGEVRFLITAEISNIYKRDGQVRKVHNLVFVPTLEIARKIAGRLERIGNIASDGRPILGLDSRDLLEIVREASPDAFLVPAHIWTPWFSVLGSQSGFDSVEACYGDLAGEIFCVETGLSSDPAMNGRLSALDRYALISNSDAHSPDKLGREANRFDCGLSFGEIRDALRSGRGRAFLGTVEFFPEQGKYHLDGHRKCGSRMHPAETLQRGCLCPVCGKKVTVGVMHRVEDLADRPEGVGPEGSLPYQRLVSLAEVVGEVKGSGPQTKGVQTLCRQLIQRLGPEISILSRAPLEEIRREGGEPLAEGIRRMRGGEVALEAGYDGEFGVVRLFRPEERERFGGQMALVGTPDPADRKGPRAEAKLRRRKARKASENDADGGDALCVGTADPAGDAPLPNLFDVLGSQRVEEACGVGLHRLLEGLNPEQSEAVLFLGAPVVIVAGPGTGKTHTLTRRIAWMVLERGVPADRVLAVTFTQRAAREMEERLVSLLDAGKTGLSVHVKTFHALGADLLRQAVPDVGIPAGFRILSREDVADLLKESLPEVKGCKVEELLERISLAKRDLLYPEDGGERFDDEAFLSAYWKYQQALNACRALDYDDLVSRTVRALDRCEDFRASVAARFRSVSVDEYQDVNRSQYRFLRHLAATAEDLCVIGDPQQAIYGFRGASPRYFNEFEKDFPSARVVRLVRNYRSTATVVSASVQMISSALESGDRPRLIASRGGGERIQEVEVATERSEAIFVAQTIENLVGGTDSMSLYAGRISAVSADALRVGFGDVAVLYRLNAQGPLLQDALWRQGIPCQGAAQADRWKGREGRALVALVRCLMDPEDPLAWRQACGAFKCPEEELRAEVDRYRQERMECRAGLTEWVMGLAGFGERGDFREREWREAWEALVRAATSHRGDWEGLIRILTLSEEPDFLSRKAQKVTLATLHAAKGLEFPVVFVVGCEDALVPCTMGSPAPDPREERRLFYVGMTRASQRLYLTRARSRFLYGARRPCLPSPFLADIPSIHLDRIRPRNEGSKKQSKKPEQPSLFTL